MPGVLFFLFLGTVPCPIEDMKVLESNTALSISLLILGITVRCLYGYRTGAPTRACGDMTPQHGYQMQTSPAPYLVEISKTQYSPNERIYVRLRACGDERFKGFMIQPRSAIFPNRAAFLGAFARVQGTRYECVRTGAVLTHNSPVDKQSVTLVWIAPPGAAGHVVFRVTFVQSFTKYWVSINSPVVYDGVSRDLTMMQAFSLQSSTDQSCLPPRSTTPAPTTTTSSTTTTPLTTTTTMTTTTTTTTTTEPTTTTTTAYPTTTTTTEYVPWTTTTTTAPTTTTTNPTTTTTTMTTPYWTSRTDETSTDYWPDYWDSTTMQANESTTETVVPTIFPTVSYPTTTSLTSTTPITTTTEATTTTTTEATTTTTTEPPPPTIFTTTTTTAPSTTTTTPLPPPTTTTTTTIPTTTTTTAGTTTTTTDIPTTTTTTMSPTTTTTTSLPVTTEITGPSIVTDPATIPTTAVYFTTPGYPTTPNYPATPVYPTEIWTEYSTSSKAPIAATSIETSSTTAVPDARYTTTTDKLIYVRSTTDTISAEPSVPNITFPQFTDIVTEERLTTTEQPLLETSTTDKAAVWPTTVGIETTPPAWETTTQTSIIETDLELIQDRECGVTQGCFDDCRDGVCNFIISWTSDRYSTTFEIRTRPSVKGPYWAAIGFSDDKMMGLDSVTECITEGNKVSVYQSHNLDYYRNLRLITPKLGITDEYGRMQNGIFYCSFTRDNYLEGQKDVFDLNKNWFMMFAEGPAVNGIKIPHRYDVIPPTTDVRVDLQQYPPMHITYNPVKALPHKLDNEDITDSPVPIDKQLHLSPDESCGVSQTCFQDCTPLGCRFIVSWISGPQHVIFKLRAVLNGTSDRWIAIAFSHDNKMGQDNVVQCISNDHGEISVSQSYNEGKVNMKIDEAQVGLTNTSGSFVDGVFECGFVRQRNVENTKKIFDLEKPWNILFATGRAKNGIMLPHSFKNLPHASDNAIDFTKLEPSLLTANTMFIKIHAALMLFGWILCASVATVIGRYFQPFWWGEKMFGSKAWVQVHWFFVILTLLTVIASFSLIFVGVDGMSKLYQQPSANFNSAHPVMGLVVTVLVLLNPLLLLLRPSAESQTRTFFDCVYWLVEMGAHILAVITIYAGFGLAKYIVPAILAYLLIGFACYQVLVLLFMEALKSYDAKKTVEQKKMYLYEMQIRPWNPRRNNSLSTYMDVSHSSKGLKRVILSLHFLVLTALTTVMILLLAISEPKSDGIGSGMEPIIH